MTLQKIMQDIHAANLTDEQCRSLLMYLVGSLGIESIEYNTEIITSSFASALQSVKEINKEF